MKEREKESKIGLFFGQFVNDIHFSSFVDRIWGHTKKRYFGIKIYLSQTNKKCIVILTPRICFVFFFIILICVFGCFVFISFSLYFSTTTKQLYGIYQKNTNWIIWTQISSIKTSPRKRQLNGNTLDHAASLITHFGHRLHKKESTDSIVSAFPIFFYWLCDIVSNAHIFTNRGIQKKGKETENISRHKWNKCLNNFAKYQQQQKLEQFLFVYMLMSDSLARVYITTWKSRVYIDLCRRYFFFRISRVLWFICVYFEPKRKSLSSRHW